MTPTKTGSVWNRDTIRQEASRLTRRAVLAGWDISTQQRTDGGIALRFAQQDGAKPIRMVLVPGLHRAAFLEIPQDQHATAVAQNPQTARALNFHVGWPARQSPRRPGVNDRAAVCNAAAAAVRKAVLHGWDVDALWSADPAGGPHRLTLELSDPQTQRVHGRLILPVGEKEAVALSDAAQDSTGQTGPAGMRRLLRTHPIMLETQPSQIDLGQRNGKLI